MRGKKGKRKKKEKTPVWRALPGWVGVQQVRLWPTCSDTQGEGIYIPQGTGDTYIPQGTSDIYFPQAIGDIYIPQGIGGGAGGAPGRGRVD